VRRIAILSSCLLMLFFFGSFAFPKTCSASSPCANEVNGKCVAVETGIGTIGTDPKMFVQTIYSFVLGIAGGIALVLIIISGYQYMTSQGDPEKLKAANERLTAAIIGLLFIIFSFVILQVIGVDILKIPGFS